MKHYYVIFILLCFASEGISQTLEDDRLALVALYNATGQNWIRHTGWESPGTVGSSPCGWSGITCKNERVTEVNLPDYNLTGYLPVQIGNLTALTRLRLDRTSNGRYGISGALPASLGNLTNLEYLSLSGNSFTGELPSTLGKLAKLKVLDLSHRFFSSVSPSRGQLTGAIPNEIGNLTNLTYLNLYRQNFTGNLPNELGNLTNLVTLNLSDNDFTGSIPAGLGNLLNLKTLDLSYYYYEFGDFRGRKGRITGNIPASFANLSAIEYLSLSGQSLSGGLANLSTMPVSATISIRENNFTFTGIEGNVNRFDHYGNQALIPLQILIPLAIPAGTSGPSGLLYVDAGGTMSNNTFRWYRNGTLKQTKVGIHSYYPSEIGTYRVEVTNQLIPNLTLISDNYIVTHLPVTLVSFTGENTSSGNVLKWKTTSETNNMGFEIEKSDDAKYFKTVGFIDGNGDSKVQNNYHFNDNNPFSTTYYRLKQIDNDSRFEYSRIISVKRNLSRISIYPNPARNQIFVKDLERAEQIIVRNTEGKTLLIQTCYPQQPIDLDNFSNGLYLVTIGDEIRKVVIER